VPGRVLLLESALARRELEPLLQSSLLLELDLSCDVPMSLLLLAPEWVLFCAVLELALSRQRVELADFLPLAPV
jgi:hypothetical protein